MVDTIRETLHHVAGILVWPVLLSLLALAAGMLITLGAFAHEALERRRGQRHGLEQAARALDAAVHEASPDALDLRIEESLQDTERLWWRALGRLRLAVRVGPSLGLMGTLIPMADALQGLATGDLPALARNMVTAFAATVIGLTISVIAYLVSSAREEWVTADVASLAFHAERLARTPGRAERKAS